MLHLLRRLLVITSLLLLIVTLLVWVGSRLRQEQATLHLHRNWMVPQKVHKLSANESHWQNPHVQFLLLIVDRGWVLGISHRFSDLSGRVNGVLEMAGDKDAIYGPGISAQLNSLPYGNSSDAGDVWFRASRNEKLGIRPRFQIHPDYGMIHGWTFHQEQTTWIAIPAWLLAVLFGIAPMIGFIRLVRNSKRLKYGHCFNCGYDLRATPDRCPECGKEVKGR